MVNAVQRYGWYQIQVKDRLQLTGDVEEMGCKILILLNISTILPLDLPFNKTSGVLGWLIQAGDEGYLCRLVFDIKANT